MSDLAAPAPTRAGALLTLAPGLAWGLAQFVAFAFVVEPGPESASQVAVLFFLCLYVGLVHAGLFAAAAVALGRRLPRAGDALLADRACRTCTEKIKKVIYETKMHIASKDIRKGVLQVGRNRIWMARNRLGDDA